MRKDVLIAMLAIVLLGAATVSAKDASLDDVVLAITSIPTAINDLETTISSLAIQGPQGEQGPQGVQGPPGPADGDWTISSNDMYSNVSGNVGIGTTSPDRDLEVSGVLRVAREANNAHGADFSYVVDEPRTGHDGLIINSDTGGGWSDIHLRTRGTTKLFVESSGKVGIGTDSPSEKLEVVGGDILDTTPVAFLAFNNAEDEYSTPGDKLVDFDVEEFDYGSNFADDTFTAPTTGVYHFDVSVNFIVPDGNFMVLHLQINGAKNKRLDFRYSHSNVAWQPLTASITTKLNQGDIVNILCYSPG
jgi:hypothetical protein